MANKINRLNDVRCQPKLDLIGKRFGRLVVTEYAVGGKWKCLCDCGEVKIVIAYHLKNGDTQSCGCLHREGLSAISFRHGHTNTKFYRIWKNMKNRCTNPNATRYKNYGGRGITIDPKWNKFLGFKEEMYFKFLYAKKQQYKTEDLSIEREDINGNYNFENCVFIPMKNQWINKQRKPYWFKITTPIGGVIFRKNLVEFAKKIGLDHAHCYECARGERQHHKGFKFERITHF